MPTRFDISEKLIHFTSGESADDAFARLRAIIGERRLIAGNRMIRGGYRCVCFTEAPPAAFADAFVSRAPFTRCSRFGLMFDKTWVYDRGGRPVIYQPDSDFSILPEALRWRHVRFEPTSEQVIDFTWEREWRIPCDELTFSAANHFWRYGDSRDREGPGAIEQGNGESAVSTQLGISEGELQSICAKLQSFGLVIPVERDRFKNFQGTIPHAVLARGLEFVDAIRSSNRA
jgi:hypothetical protein